MSIDRVVRWKDRKPTPNQVRLVLTDFVGAAAEVRRINDRWYIHFHSDSSWPLQRVAGETPVAQERRWIEVWEDDERTGVWVITRQQDEFVGAIRDGIAGVFARYWQGELE